MKGILFVISGPSGAGKGTILERVLKNRQNIEFSVSATTRSPRPGEVEGIHYFFITREEFKQKIESSKFLEWAHVHDEYYGTLREWVQSRLDEGHDVVLDIDVQGALQIMKNAVDEVFIFIAAPSIDELHRRLTKRGTESEEKILRRLEVARHELEHVSKYEYLIINDDLSLACEQLNAIIASEKCRTKRLACNLI
ncbi:MAG: guanylate kinase [Candidatus Xenobiia bacterium LiM19]